MAVAAALLLAGCATPENSPASALALTAAAVNAPAQAGPTLHFSFTGTNDPGNTISEFMYFVRLISPEPVVATESPGNTQRARIVSASRRVEDHRFNAVCEFEITGDGWQRNTFDHSANIRRNEKQLQAGKPIDRQLGAITVDGRGIGVIEVEGTVSNRVPTVTEVRLRFNNRGQASPIQIDLHDVVWQDGAVKLDNELVARVNSLTFQRTTNRPKMAVTVASVKSRHAGNSLWQRVKGSVAGTAVNLLIKPLAIEVTGYRAMMDFGQALLAEQPTFTFPRAREAAPAP